MLMDKDLILSEAQEVKGDASLADVTVDATNYFDFGAKDDSGLHPVEVPGEVNMLLVSKVHTNYAGAGVTLRVGIYVSDDDNTYVELVTSGAVGVAALLAGAFICQIPLPKPLKRYMKVTYTISGGNCTAGKVTTFLTQGA